MLVRGKWTIRQIEWYRDNKILLPSQANKSLRRFVLFLGKNKTVKGEKNYEKSIQHDYRG